MDQAKPPKDLREALHDVRDALQCISAAASLIEDVGVREKLEFLEMIKRRADDAAEASRWLCYPPGPMN